MTDETSPIPTNSPPGAISRADFSSMGWRSLELLVVMSLAIAQPLFSLFGANATYLAAHDLIGSDLLRFAFTIVLVPTLLLIAVETIVQIIAPRAAVYVHAGVIGILLGLLVGPPLNRLLGIDGGLSVAVLMALIVGATMLVASVEVVTRLLRFGFFAPVLVLVLFLALSPASRLLDNGVAVSELTATPADAPIVWVTFDQFPLSYLVDEQGEIVEERYPNFARLAELSTWYQNTSSIALNTSQSMPAALSGLDPSSELAVASAYPNNLFTLFANTHEVLADEYVTQLCPDFVCRHEPRSSGRDSLWSDTRAVFVRTVLAPDVADRFVPPVDDRWSGFGNEQRNEGDVLVADEAQNGADLTALQANSSDDRSRFQGFLDGFAPDELPSLHYIHLFQPHEPLRYLPSGQRIDIAWKFSVDDEGRWPDNQEMMDQRLQRYVLQAMHADREVGRLLDRLEETELLDDALIVVMSDHGVASLPGALNRAFAPETMDDLLPVPIFIKRPGQRLGEVDRRLAQQTDILPTVLDLMEVDEGSRPSFDGTSLVAPADPTRSARLRFGGSIKVLDRPPNVLDSPTIEWISSLIPDPANPYAFGPDGDLVGQDVASQILNESDLSVSLGMEAQLQDVDPDGAYVPANIHGTVSGRDRSSRLAVAVNGTIAGVGSSFFNNGWQMTVIVDPTYFVDGRNDVQILEVGSDGLKQISAD